MALIGQLQGFIYWKELTFNYVYEISPEVLHQWAVTQRLGITHLCRIHQFCSPDAVFVKENKAVSQEEWESKGDVWWGAGLHPVLLLSEGAGAGAPPAHQLATKSGGGVLAGGSDAADGGGALSGSSDSEGLCLTAAGSLSAAWWSRGLLCQSV